MCMVVTIVGIKLWWFKHRLSFEQTSTQNGAAGGGTPPVIVPRRSKTQKYKRNKRYSQQIYDSVEVHGVFRQKREDELEIQRPQQLPPVRIRQLSDSTSSLILPPPRNKRRDQVHSTAFEDLEIATPPLTTASSSDLTAIRESNTKISLTFEEFEKQFKLKEIKPEVPEPSTTHEVLEIPVPPLRLNRSSSAMVKPEKTPRYLKSSQSITIPEFHKVIERRPTGFSRPTEDLTKIDDYDEPKLFETFGERRPTGYIKYEEVDVDLQEQYEKELNAELAKDDRNWGNPQELPALDALRNERIIYNNNLNESPDVQYTEKYNFDVKSYKFSELEDVEYKEEDFMDQRKNKMAEIKEISSVTFEELDTESYPNNEAVFAADYRSVNDRRPTEFVKQPQRDEVESVTEFKTVKESRSREFDNGPPNDGDVYKTDFVSVKDRNATEFAKESPNAGEEFVTEFRSVKERRPTEFNKGTQSEEFVTEFHLVGKQRSTEYVNEPQSNEEECVTELRSVKERRPTEFVKDTQSDEEEEFLSVQEQKSMVNHPKATQKQLITEYRSVKEHRPTDFAKDYQQDFEEEFVTEFRSVKECRSTEYIKDEFANGNSEFFESSSLQEDFDSQFTSWPQFEEKIETPKVNVRRFNNHHLESQNSFEEEQDFLDEKHKEQSSISFNVSETNDKFTLNQRRPTGYVRNWPESPDLSETEEWQETSHSQKKVYSQVRSLMTTESTTYLQQREVTFESSTVQSSNQEFDDNSAIKQRRPTGFVRNNDYYVTFNDESDEDQNESPRHTNEEMENFQPPKVKFNDEEFQTWAESETEKFTLNQRRPTGFIRTTNTEDLWNEINLQQDPEDFPKGQVKFDKSTDFKDEQEIWNSDIKQRRPTGFIRKMEMLELSDDENFTTKERRPTLEDEEYSKHDWEYKDIPLSPNVRFKEMEHSFSDSENNSESLIKQRRPTGFVRKEELDKMEKQVNFQINEEDSENFSQENEALKQRRPTGFVRKEEVNKQVNFQLQQNSDEEGTTKFGNEELRQRRPTGFARKKDLSFLENPPPLYQAQTNDSRHEFDDQLWQEMEKDIENDFSHNIEEEFTKIRHSYEVHEADFLEKSPLNSPQQPLGFGKSIEDDWINFEQLKTQQIAKANLQSPQEIKITFSDAELTAATTSILKEPKIDEDIQAKPRKSKVTFDFKTEEHVIPGRNAQRDLEFESDYDDDDDVYNKPPPPIPPQPMQRLSNINYNTESTLTPIVTIPKTISLFGSQISHEDNDNEDSWSAIRKHRNLTVELQNITTTADSKLSSPPPDFNTPPPKPAYRNPMAQLAIQRAKEVRADMDGFKARSINDKKPEASKRNKQKFLDLNNDDYEGTEA
ncbi:LOW QUALITY PROTEIN: trichohyalin-like [Lucilia sericata]|uniref:LOW QUALITY PROTEIN: trichohyalin-like n=1 Tax=Lucilia sericata TaxID=13632 RepID=UPI0018A832F7|nr:LOW QUALITY PROTEIN: trichohyalin-like [Lucilia sericata]